MPYPSLVLNTRTPSALAFARAATLGMGYPRVARAAFAAYRNRRTIKKAFRLGKRAYRYASKFKQARKKARRVAGAQNRSPRVQHWIDGTSGGFQGEVGIDRKVLFNETILFARAPGSTNDDFGTAQANRIYVKGIKLCMMLRNSAPEHMLQVHWAIIQEKRQCNVPDQIETEFFTDPTDLSSRYRDFVPVGTNPAWEPRNLCQGINPSRFNIITHQSLKLDKANNGVSPHQVKIDKYMKIGKTFQYERSTSLQVERPLIFCIWYERLSSVTGSTNDLVVNVNTTSYFKSLN